MTRSMRGTVGHSLQHLVFTLVLVVAVPVAAGEFEDAVNAFKAGESEIAIKILRSLAEQGDAVAQYNLGVIYSHGYGISQDYQEAIEWYRLAADQGHMGAQDNLKMIYDKGHGVPQNSQANMRWCSLAAELGDAKAQYDLGVMYAYGLGVPQDYVRAHLWFNLAAAYGKDEDNRKDAVRNRELVASMMDPGKIAEALRLASEWQPK